MRKFVPMVLVMSMAAAGIPLKLSAAQPETNSLTGTAFQSNLQPFANARVQVRNIRTGESLFATTTGQAGEFAFGQLPPESYIVEILDPSGKIVGMSAPFTVGTGRAVNVSVVAVAPGAAATSGDSAGFSLFGLGPTTSLAVLGAAGAAAVTAVVATRQDASPSR
jgi:hypothetical protein